MELRGLKKIIKTGHIIEVYNYEKALKCTGGDREVSKGSGENQDKNYIATQRKRRDNIRRLACANFDNRDKFVTLTYAVNMTDLQRAKSDHRNFTYRLQRKLDRRVPYLSVVEFQNRGAVHFHSLMKMPYIENRELRQIWGNGFVRINPIDHVDNLGAYLIKYMTKTDDPRLKGERAYMYSQGLEKPKIVTSYNACEYRTAEEELKSLIKGKEPVYTREFDTEKLGKARYQQYNLARE